MRSELSERSKYYIGKYRYYELKYFCLQYPDWVKAFNAIANTVDSKYIIKPSKENSNVDKTSTYALAMDVYDKKITLLMKCAIEADEELAPYILKGVTENRSYDAMNAKDPIPCSRDTYYDRYRRFFYILSQFKED